MSRLSARLGIALLAAVACGGAPQPTFPPARSLVGGYNAMWLQSMYFRGHHPTNKELRAGAIPAIRPLALTDAMLVELAQRLTRARIRYAYIFAGPFDAQGDLPAYAFSQTARDSIALLRKHAPDLKILPWVGGVQGDQVRLEDPVWVERAVGSIERLLREMPVDGVHVDLEYVLFDRGPDPAVDYVANFRNFYVALRREVPDAFISSVVPSTVDGPQAWKLRHATAEVAEFVPFVDQLVILFFDTGIRDRADFRRSMSDQLDAVAGWKAAAPQTEFLLALGTFVNADTRTAPYRDLDVEGIDHHFEALTSALRGRAGLLAGHAVYCEWETDEEEWQQLALQLGSPEEPVEQRGR